jgi:hypothetical protein
MEYLRPDGMWPLGKQRRRWKNNFKINMKEQAAAIV